MVYLTALRELLRKTRCALHTYCLMTNHVHLLLTPPDEAACGTLMRDLGRKYVRYFNDRYERTGTLWEGRFHSCPVDSREYVLDCYRYIELNPVRARMAQQGSDYPWSSHRANALGGDDPSLTPHIEYTALGIDRTARLAAYRDFCSAQEQAGFLSAIREATHGGYPLVAKGRRRGKGFRRARILSCLDGVVTLTSNYFASQARAWSVQRCWHAWLSAASLVVLRQLAMQALSAALQLGGALLPSPRYCW
jgi:putative transposase